MARPAPPPPRSLVDEQGRVVCERCEVAKTVVARMRGLLGRRSLEPGHGLLLRPAWSIHTGFLDRQLRVRSIAADVRPVRIVWRRGSRSVLELPAGEAARVGLRVGSELSWHHQGR